MREMQRVARVHLRLSGLCVCVLGMWLHCAKTAEPTVSRFGGQTLMPSSHTRAARRSCLPGLRPGGGGRQAGATVLSCLAWRCELAYES